MVPGLRYMQTLGVAKRYRDIDMDIQNSETGGDMNTECKHPKSTHQPEYERSLYESSATARRGHISEMKVVHLIGTLLDLERGCSLLSRDRYK